MIKLDQISIVGVGLLGGSIGLALQAAGFLGRRLGVGRRAGSLKNALAVDAVDAVTRDVAEGVAGAGLVVLCSPIGRFEALLRAMGPALPKGCIVTDVGSTKAEVVKLAERVLPKHVAFVGSHPMAGSEKTGVGFARADLFDRALCLVTPTAKTSKPAVRAVKQFWEVLGARTMVVSPGEHDKLVAGVSHLPHVVAAALVHLAIKSGAIDVAATGFADTTRVASGAPEMWTDILHTNRAATIREIDRLGGELQQLKRLLERDDVDALADWLKQGKTARDKWIAKRYRKKEINP